MNRKAETRSRGFRGAGGTVEHFISVTADGHRSLDHQIEQILEHYEAEQRSLGLTADTAIFRRVFVTDAMNQAKIVRDSALTHLPGAKVALLAYHRAGGGPIEKHRLSPHHLLVTTQGQRHLWTTGLCAAESGAAASPLR